MKYPILVIGGGLSGLAAAIRVARFHPNVLLLEKHSRIGGLNSYFYRNNNLFETGLHAITNFAEPKDKKAPLNRLLRQLKLKRDKFSFCEQYQSEIVFKGQETLRFSNDFDQFSSEINTKFPHCNNRFQTLVTFLADFDPFVPCKFKSTKQFLLEVLGDSLLVEMILCPLMYYGSSHENDMDLSQFAIMFQAIYLEGMFRPSGNIKDFLDLLEEHLLTLGGQVRTCSGVEKIIHHQQRVYGVLLSNGEQIECDYLLSTIGLKETMNLLGDISSTPMSDPKRLGFVENIYQIPKSDATLLPQDKTIIFYNDAKNFSYKSPDEFVDFSSGVICFPGNFQGIKGKDLVEIRSTHLANFNKWKNISTSPAQYRAKKKQTAEHSGQTLEKLIGSFTTNIVYQNTFTPVTIERYTSKIAGAIYGNPTKVKDGDIGYKNLYLAGTDQGFLGIVGSMLSGVSIINQHILPKL